MLVPGKKNYDKSRQHIIKQRHYFADKGLSSQNYGFSSSHVWMWEFEHKEGWAPKNWCFQTVVGEDLRVLWTTRRSNWSILKEISPEYSLEGLMLKLKRQYFGHLMWRANSLENTLMLGKTEDRKQRGWQEMKWLNHWLNGHEFEQTLGDGEGQGSLEYCNPLGLKKLDTSEQMNNNKQNYFSLRLPWNLNEVSHMYGLLLCLVQINTQI